MQLSVCLAASKVNLVLVLFLLSTLSSSSAIAQWGAQWRPAQGRLINQSASYKVRGKEAEFPPNARPIAEQQQFANSDCSVSSTVQWQNSSIMGRLILLFSFYDCPYPLATSLTLSMGCCLLVGIDCQWRAVSEATLIPADSVGHSQF